MSEFEKRVIKRDGQFIYVIENDGHAFMRRGPEREERVLDPDSASDQSLIKQYYR